MTKPKTLSAALAQVRGRPVADTAQPATLAEALAQVRAAKPAPMPSPRKAASHNRAAMGDGLPGLRKFMEDRRNGR